MTTAAWLTRAKRDEAALTKLLAAYHPAAPGEKRELPITAGRTEAFLVGVRAEIADKGGDPTEKFRTALAAGDVSALMTLLNEAWFGVPESTSCWDVPGFKEAVALLDEPPEDD